MSRMSKPWIMSTTYLVLVILFSFVSFHLSPNTSLPLMKVLLKSCYSQRPLDANDVYTFCGTGRARGSISLCQGYCPDTNTRCSYETGVCSCTTVKTISNASSNYNCKSAASRTRCSNACKTYAAIESFRRGESKICTSKLDNRVMCFCMPRIK